MKNKEVLLLHSCNQWHERDSYRLMAVFTNWANLEDFMTDRISAENLQSLFENNQTQGLERNYIILTEKLNPERL